MENIKKLREITGAGMVDCKKALEETGNDIDKAVELLRKKGIAKAAKRGDRETCEGTVKMAVNKEHTEGYIVELNAETDFVARNEKFQNLADQILAVIQDKKPSTIDELNALPLGSGTVLETIETLSGTIGEKMGVKGFEIVKTSGTVASYSHLDGRIGVLVALDQTGKEELAYDLAMQIAATNPKYLVPEEVPTEETDKEKEIYREQLKKEGKPDNIVEKILLGKINKYYEDVCLVRQEFIKDDKKKVENILGGVKIEKFVRFSL
jgi:elongation factor Ts